MQYSVIYGHFEKVYCKVGQVLSKGDKIGYMGTTGHSTGIHTHISVIEGFKKWCWSLASMVNTNKPSKEECLKLLNSSILNGVEPIIECGWLGYKNHYGYDFIGARDVCWSLDVKAKVTAIGNLPSKKNGWGNFVVVTYEYPNIPQNSISVGDRVVLNSNATFYQHASKGVKIPNSIKNKEYTVQQVDNECVLLKEITSWVLINECTLASSEIVYTVVSGDTLSKIAKKYNTTWQKIYEDNKDVIGDNPNLIKVGQKLIIK